MSRIAVIREIFDFEDRKILVLAMASLIENERLTPLERQRADAIRLLCIDAIEAGQPLIDGPLKPAKIL